MAEIISPQIQERRKEGAETNMAATTVEGYGGGMEEKPTRSEILVWYLYELCFYFVHTVLIPIVFPLIISQTVANLPEPGQGWFKSYKGLKCKQSEMQLYEGLVHRAIKLGNTNFSPLQWTTLSWLIGLILSAPILGLVSTLLDHGHHQHLIPASATAIGALFCLPAGFLRKPYIFPPYIAAIVAASTVATATHARNLGLMIRAFTGPAIPKRRFPNRRSFGSWLSLYSTAAGCLGAAIMASFTDRMYSHSDHFTALWVVSIFSGLVWGFGMIHIFSTNRTTLPSDESERKSFDISHVVSIFGYPDALGSLAGVFLSSFMTMCVFGAALLYAIGYICVKPVYILLLFLVYFMMPLVFLPAAYPLQQALRLDAEKMQLFGFMLSTFVSGFGFYYHGTVWHNSYLLLFAAVQGTATGFLHAFGRVLWLDCSPAGKEGVFSVWFSWARALGSCAGFAVATGMPGNVGRAFGASFCAGIVGMVVLIFGNISSLRGAKAAGHVVKSEKASTAHRLDDHLKGSVI